VSKARLVITAVVVEGRGIRETARRYTVSPGWVSRLISRYRVEGEAAFEPRSRRPHTHPRAIPAATAELIIRLRHELTRQGLDAGAHTIAWHLAEQHQLTVSPATIWRTLKHAGLIIPEPSKKPKAAYVCFAAEQVGGFCQLRGVELSARMMIGQTLMRKASAAGSQPATTAIPDGMNHRSATATISPMAPTMTVRRIACGCQRSHRWWRVGDGLEVIARVLPTASLRAMHQS
jgi:transposase